MAENKRLEYALRRLSLVQRDPVSIPHTDIFGLRPDDATLCSLLEDVSDPACHAADGKCGGEQIRRHTQAMQEQSRVKLDVCFEVTFGVTLRQKPNRNVLYFPREGIEFHIAGASVHLFRRGGQHLRTRIARSIHTMTETHEPLASFQFLSHKTFGSADIANFKDHVQGRSGCTSVEWSLQSADRAYNRGDKI